MPGSARAPGRCSPTELDAQQLLDLVFTVGAYETLAMAMRTFGVEVDDDLAAWRSGRK
jgi:hypothetical protein